MSDLQLRVYTPDNQTFLGTLHGAYQRSFVDELNGHGTGRFSVDLDDPQAGLVQPRRVIRWRIGGTDRFASFVDDMPSVIADADERPAVAVSGPGLAGWLGTGRGGAIVYPPTLESRAESRFFGWASLGYSTPGGDGWQTVGRDHTMGTRRNPSSSLPRLVGEPPGWPDGRSEWIVPYPLTPSGGGMIHPGTNSFLLRRTLPASVTGPARIFVVGSNEWDLYWDGERIGSGGGFRRVGEFDVQLEGRQTVIGLHVRHQRTPGFRWDPCIGMVAVRALDANGDPGGALFRTYTPHLNANIPQTWRILPSPDDLPGPTPGYAAATLFDEARGRGALPSMTRGWTASQDTAGLPWGVSTLNHAWPVGRKLSDVVDELTQLAGVEYRVTPAGRLELYNRLGQGRPGTLGPYVEASTSGEGVRATTLLGATDRGYVERARAAQVALYGRIEDAVDLGGTPDPRAARGLVDRILGYTARPADVHELTLSDSSPQPYTDFEVGDSFADGRVTQIACVQDDQGGGLEWAVTLTPEEG